MAEAPCQGNQYTNIFNFGGRNQQGNTYHSHGLGQSADEQMFNSILESLHYHGMDERRDTLTDAESGTFKWALAEEEREFANKRELRYDGEMHTDSTFIDVGFTKWLQEDEEGLFCFMGKPGSGKSTLMKFLATTESEIDKALQRWAKGRTIIRSEHYFWMLGTPIQKTCEGMLRSLLHSLLQSIRSTDDEVFDLIKRAYGTRWSSNNSRRAWNCDDLHQMLARLTSGSTRKFFLLVDALDECEPQNRPETVAAEILNISKLPNVKLCISCRPRKRFTSEFEWSRIIHMDQLTYSDMEKYTETRLIEADPDNDLCADFRDKTIAAKKFVNEVVQSAEGVFLWNKLVIEEFCGAIRSGCSLSHLKSMLSEFPVGLDGYFEQLITNRIAKSPRNNVNTAATLKLALAITESASNHSQPRPDSFLNFWLLRGGHLKPGFSWKDHNGRWYFPEDVQQMVAQTRSFLEESCKDLLVMVDKRAATYSRVYYSEMRWDVRFLHRTVADFLRDKHTVSSTIKEHSPAHLADENFLDDLCKTRCLHLLHEMQAGCATAETDFIRMLKAPHPQTWTQDDVDFVSACETHMIQRFEEACDCLGTGHFRRHILRACATTGSTRYALAVLKSWPYLALSPSFVQDCLTTAAFGYLGSVNSTSGSATSESLDLCSPFESTITTSLYRLPIQQNLIQHKHGLFSYLSPRAVTNSSLELIDNLLACGGDSNDQTYWSKGECQNTVWEGILRDVCEKIHSFERETDTPERPEELGGKLQDYKRKAGDLIALFLWYGANPKCTTCTSRHPRRTGPCKRTSLQDILPNIVSQEKIAIINEMQVKRSKDFVTHFSQRGQRLRAIRSWVQSEQSFVAHAGRHNNRDQSRIDKAWLSQQYVFLRVLTKTERDRTCDKCLKEPYLDVTMWCIDCNGRYSLCKKCSKEVEPEISNGKVSMGNIIHEKIPLVGGHTSIAFGSDHGAYFGTEESLSALKEWHARNSVEPDSGVD